MIDIVNTSQTKYLLESLKKNIDRLEKENRELKIEIKSINNCDVSKKYWKTQAEKWIKGELCN